MYLSRLFDASRSTELIGDFFDDCFFDDDDDEDDDEEDELDDDDEDNDDDDGLAAIGPRSLFRWR